MNTQTLENTLSRIDKEIILDVNMPTTKVKEKYHKVKLKLAELQYSVKVLNDMII